MQSERHLSRTNFIGETLVATVCGASRTSFSTAFSADTSSSLPASMSDARLVGSEHGVDG
jgi:AraC-like DNA-binding protein